MFLTKNQENKIKKYLLNIIKDRYSNKKIDMQKCTHYIYQVALYFDDLSEVFVESIAYIVADHFGLDTSLCSFNYIIKYAHGEPKTVINLGTKIQKCANEFIDKIEKFNMHELKLTS